MPEPEAPAPIPPAAPTPPPERPQRVRLVHGQEVSLGCGTLILIAIIVMIFSRGGINDLEREVERLRSDIRELKSAVDNQTNQLKTLQEKLEKRKE